MSSLFLEDGARARVSGPTPRARLAACAGAAAACGALAAPAGAIAAEVYVQPLASVMAAYNTNIDMLPGYTNKGPQYSPDVGAVIGIATPISQVTIRPDVRYEYYPTDTGNNRLEALLDLYSTYSTRLDRLTVSGRFDRRDDLNAEIPSAEYNTITPTIPNTPSSGRVTAGVVRDNFYLTPTYVHNVTPLTGLGISATAQRITYTPDNQTYLVDFNYFQVKPYIDLTVDPRTDLSVGAIASRYSALNIDSSTNAYGAQIELQHNWSPLLRSDVTISDQRTSINQLTPLVVQATSNNWGADVGVTYTGLVDQLRLEIGRTLLPSSGGALYNTDQAQAQYDHEFTERLQSTVAVLYQKTGTLTTGVVNDARTYATTTLSLKWMVTQRLFVRGGLSYAWQRFSVLTGSADNNQVSVQFGYQGLGRQY